MDHINITYCHSQASFMIITTTATSSISGGGLYIGVASFPISPLLTSTIKSRSLKASPHHHHSRRRLLCVRCLSSLSEDSSLILHHHRHHHRLPLSSYSIKSRPVGDSLHHHHHCRRHLRQAPSPCLSVCCSSSLSDMDGTGGPSLYPLHHCKTLHLVRHAQGIHNVDGDKNYKAYMKLEYFDAQLTPLGWQQVDNLRKHVHACGLFKTVDLVITSPLLRTMQTAVGVFGGEGYTDRMDVVPLMVANAGNSDRPAISSLDCPPIIAVEHCREHLGVHPCDMRRSISEYQRLFPAVDFSLIETDEDVLWKADIRETKEELEARGMKFMNWLLTRKEREIAIVTHSGFLFHTLSAFGNDSHPLVKKEICKHKKMFTNSLFGFANCELRSMVIVDKSMLGSDLSTTNYPGKIPPGPDLPSDVVDEKNLN